MGRVETALPRSPRLVMHGAPIEHFVGLLAKGERFSLAGFSDAEWYCILGKRLGTQTGLGQTIEASHGVRLAETIKKRSTDPSFKFAIPSCLWELPEFENRDIDKWLVSNNIKLTCYERDMLTDDLAARAGLYPFLLQLWKMDVVIIGNQYLRGLDDVVINYRKFIEIASPNLHLRPGGIKEAVAEAENYGKSVNTPLVYLVSAGVSAASIIDRLHDRLSDCWFIDCGSIWDAFVGVGGQREWRRQLYANPEKLAEWRGANLSGTPYTPPKTEEEQ